VTVNINAEFNLMAVNTIIECFPKNLVPENGQSLQSSMFYTAPPMFVEYLPCHSSRRQPRLPLHRHGEEIIPTFLTSNIYIQLCVRKSLTLTRLRSYTIFKVFLIFGMNPRVGLPRIFNFCRLRSVVPYRLPRGTPLKEGVP
jgi:hypothetical protein